MRKVSYQLFASRAAALLAAALMGSIPEARGQATSLAALKMMSIDELMDFEITSVSRKPERWFDAASAVQVVTGSDIRRSGSTSLPEALRLAPNLRVAQVNSYGWVVTARGFSGLFANKLLALVDGRTIYTPLFAGVVWDSQNLFLEDVERIEVVSGPGGTLWGANAVNGVINVTTKSADRTHGTYAEVAAGPEFKSAGARHGARAGAFDYRVFFSRTERGASGLPGGADAKDAWQEYHGGFRVDARPSADGELTLLGNFHAAKAHTVPGPVIHDGQNLLARWASNTSPDAGIRVQVFYDRNWRRDPPSTFTDRLQTWDLEFQQSLARAAGHQVIWGGGYRHIQDETSNATTFVGFVPRDRTMQLYNLFAQDEVRLGERLRGVIGAKVEHHEFSGFELQPNLRIAYAPSAQRTTWAAVSRAVRAPSRIDVDYHIPTFPVPPSAPSVAGGPGFDAEKLVSFELGHREQIGRNLSTSTALFYNDYDDLYSVEPLPGTLTYQIQNGVEGHTWGAEFAADWQPIARWRIRAGYTHFRKALRDKPGHSSDPSSLGNDPRHQASIQSILDLPAALQLDVTVRHASALPKPVVPRHTAADVRLAWTRGGIEVAAVGRNLLDAAHPEFGTQEARRSFHVKLSLRR